jgi:hypothetical protein
MEARKDWWFVSTADPVNKQVLTVFTTLKDTMLDPEATQ